MIEGLGSRASGGVEPDGEDARSPGWDHVLREGISHHGDARRIDGQLLQDVAPEGGIALPHAHLGEAEDLGDELAQAGADERGLDLGSVETEALVAIPMRAMRATRSSVSRAPSMGRTSGHSVIGRSSGPSSDMSVPPQSKSTQRIRSD